MATGTLTADAASYLKTLNARASGSSAAYLSWNALTKKQKKKVNGITVFRNGVAVKNLSKKTTAYSDTGLSAGTTYTYQVKTYKVKKQKQWFNKKTGKYQKKKPAKKYRGKAKKVKVYTYKNASPARTIRTAAATQAQTQSTGSSSGSSGGTTGGSTVDPNGYTGQVISCTDYLGKTYEYKELNSGYWEVSANGYKTTKEAVMNNYNNPLYNRTVKGEFKNSGYTWYQTGGENSATIKKAVKKSGTNFAVEMYNGDPDKLVFTTNYQKQVVNTHIDEYDDDLGYTGNIVPLKRNFIMKDGKRLIERYDDKVSSNKNLITKTAQFSSQTFADNNGFFAQGTGFVSGTVNVTAQYDGYTIGTSSFTVNPNADSEGLAPLRRAYLELAQEAVAFYKNGGTSENPNNHIKHTKADYDEALQKYGEYDADMKSICWYINDKFGYDNGTYQSSVLTIKGFPCTTGKNILETYSIYAYSKYGFEHSPEHNTDHVVFVPDENPNIYYDTNGYQDW